MDVPDCYSGVAAAPDEPSIARRDWWRQIGAWRARAASRRELARFNEHMLRDIGIDPAQQWQEARKRFWRL